MAAEGRRRARTAFSDVTDWDDLPERERQLVWRAMVDLSNAILDSAATPSAGESRRRLETVLRDVFGDDF